MEENNNLMSLNEFSSVIPAILRISFYAKQGEFEYPLI